MVRGLFLAAALSLALAACGQGGNPSGGGGEGASQQAASNQQQQRVRCPARIRTPQRAQGAPVDDIAGIRPGLTIDEAANLAQCEDRNLAVEFSNRAFNIETHGIEIRQSFEAKPRPPEMTPEQARDEFMSSLTRGRDDRLQPGQQRFYATAMGVPNEERVIGASREQMFEEGRFPPIASVISALTQKYGEPSLQRNNELFWNYDNLGRKMNRDSPNLQRCLVGAGGMSFSPDCGLSIGASISPRRDNPDLAESLSVGVVDQANGYAAIDATEQALAQLDAQRRAQELERAGKNADAPDL